MRWFFLFLTVFLFTHPAFSASLEEVIDFSRKDALIGYIEIGDKSQTISQSTYLYVKSALDHYKKERPLFILLKLNTPGGQVFAAQKICEALRDIDVQENIPVVAYIDNWAISAGAMIAYNCRFITTAEDGSMGAAEPVILGEGGQAKKASEKVNSALRASFANYARFYGRDPEIAKAMVDEDTLLVYRNGKIVALEEMKQVSSSDQLITKPGKLLTLDAKELIKYGVADILVPSTKTAEILEKEKERGTWPFNKERLSSVYPFSLLKEANVQAYQMDWRTFVFYLLATPLFTSLLTIGLIVGFYLEFNTPGFGFFGSVGLFCLILLLLSSLSIDAASWLEVILLTAGLLLLLADWTFLPTGGILSFFGVILFLAGFLALVVPGLTSTEFDLKTQTINAAGKAALERLGWLSFSFLISVFFVALAGRFLTSQAKRFSFLVLLGNEQTKEAGYTICDENTLPPVGTQGIAASTLRPSGKIVVQSIYYDAISKNRMIEKGEAITIVGFEGNNVLVIAKKDQG